MAERVTRKGKRPAARRAGERTVATFDSADRQGQRIKSLERECERLKAQLSEANERIAALDQRRAEAVTRIDWVLDSLHNVLENGS
jgi:predicted RNase H-like nuclease (RuvC/YqgF family)